MRHIFMTIICGVTLLCYSCKGGANSSASHVEADSDTIIADMDQFVKFETTQGSFTVKLYRETPLHRHNMVKRARKGEYDGQLFFGVVRNYKIQSGDPTSVNAPAGKPLGVSDQNDTIPSELLPDRFYHKRGALGQASTRQYNFSTSDQFYIITGTKSNDSALKAHENKVNKRLYKEVKDSLTNTEPYRSQIIDYNKRGYKNKVSQINGQLNKLTDEIMATRQPFSYTKEQIETYKTVGGAPDLDMLYTVFGEVTEGMEVVESISKSHIDKNGRPTPDVKILRATVIAP